MSCIKTVFLFPASTLFSLKWLRRKQVNSLCKNIEIHFRICPCFFLIFFKIIIKWKKYSLALCHLSLTITMLDICFIHSTQNRTRNRCSWQQRWLQNLSIQSLLRSCLQFLKWMECWYMQCWQNLPVYPVQVLVLLMVPQHKKISLYGF